MMGVVGSMLWCGLWLFDVFEALLVEEFAMDGPIETLETSVLLGRCPELHEGDSRAPCP